MDNRRFRKVRDILEIALLAVGGTCCWGYSFEEQSTKAANGDYAEVGRAPGKLSPEHVGEDVLSGSYNGTTFTIPLIRDNFPGMCSYPYGIHYGESSRYVWVYTHNRATDGTTLIDVATGKGVFGAHGHGTDVSPDGRRIAYTLNGRFGLFHQACVQDFVVYPAVYQQPDRGNILSFSRGDTFSDAPQMDVRYHPEWLDDDSMCFVHYDHPRLAELLRDPSIRTQWFVLVDGVGDGVTTDSIRVRRAELNHEEMALLEALEAEKEKEGRLDNSWPYRQLAVSCESRLEGVTPDSFSLDPLNHKDYPLVPKNLDYPYRSPDGSHSINVSVTGEHTDTNSRVDIEFDNQPVTLEGELFPINRLFRVPRWISNQKADLVLQTNWYDKMIYGEGEPKHWLVTVGLDEGSTQPVLRTEAISVEEANRMLQGL